MNKQWTKEQWTNEQWMNGPIGMSEHCSRIIHPTYLHCLHRQPLLQSINSCIHLLCIASRLVAPPGRYPVRSFHVFRPVMCILSELNLLIIRSNLLLQLVPPSLFTILFHHLAPPWSCFIILFHHLVPPSSSAILFHHLALSSFGAGR